MNDQMMKEVKKTDTAIIFDCEFLCLIDSPRRFWCGAHDPDPVIAQIGAAKLVLSGDFPITETISVLVKPLDRFGYVYRVDPFFTELTGITDDMIAQDGRTLQHALAELDAFSGGAQFWSWGKDELNMLAISCYVAGIPAPIPARRFDNAVKLVLAAGMPEEDLNKTRSNTLADYYKVDHPPLRSHDALGDALSVTHALQHLLQSRKLSPKNFD